LLSIIFTYFEGLEQNLIENTLLVPILLFIFRFVVKDIFSAFFEDQSQGNRLLFFSFLVSFFETKTDSLGNYQQKCWSIILLLQFVINNKFNDSTLFRDQR
jgi:hypothetical protein